ncbi:hypothetical protein GQ42DRAFT_159377 [Ramicandelaber brevisporus]|nr:hypothetical protein GQ42DRAFT_159377 [Ramicandelaber brevisporus]
MAIASRFTTALPRTAAALRRRCTIDNFAAPFNLHDELHRHFVAAHAAQAVHAAQTLQTLHAAHAAHAGHDLHQQPATSIAATAHAISSNSSSSTNTTTAANSAATINTAASTSQRQHGTNQQHQLQQQQHSPIQLTPAFIQSCLSPPPPSPQTPLSAHTQNSVHAVHSFSHLPGAVAGIGTADPPALQHIRRANVVDVAPHHCVRHVSICRGCS